jgi:tRNA(fMet)-specific endonuclease VapC
MNGRISFDTNAVIRLFKKESRVIEIIASHSLVCLPVPVVGELLYAARNSAKAEENLKTHNEFIDACAILNISRESADCYSRIRFQLKEKGRPIPENDLWIASICLEQGIPLCTFDCHFDNIEDLTIVR